MHHVRACRLGLGDLHGPGWRCTAALGSPNIDDNDGYNRRQKVDGSRGGGLPVYPLWLFVLIDKP